MRIFEIDNHFIDLESITAITPVQEAKQGWGCWGFAVHCKLHERPMWIGDSIETDHWRTKEQIWDIRATLINAWKEGA